MKCERKGDYIRIKIIGANCSNGIKLSKIVSKAVEELQRNIEIEKISDNEGRNKYSISNIPGLIIDGNVVSQGKILTVKEIKKLLT